MGLSGRGKPLALWWRTGAGPPEKGKEDCPELLTVLAVILKETWSTLAWFLAPALGSAVFPRAKFARGPTVPPERKTPLRRGTGKYVWYARCRRVTLPFHGAGLGLNAPGGTTCAKSGKQECSNQKSKIKTYQRKEKYWGRLIISSWNTGSTEINYFWLIHSAHLICISFQSPWELGLGLGLYFAVTLIPWDLLPWQPFVYSPSDWSRASIGIQPIVPGFWCSFLKASKYNSTFPRVKTLFRALGKVESYFESRAKCTLKQMKNTESRTHIYCKRHFIPTHP